MYDFKIKLFCTFSVKYIKNICIKMLCVLTSSVPTTRVVYDNTI